MGKTSKSTKGTIRFKCNKCGTQLRVQEKLGGKYIDCPKCKGRTYVPATQAEADEEGGQYGVNELVFEVPENCRKCGEPMTEGSVLCTECGYDYRKGKFREGVDEEDLIPESAIAAWFREFNFGKFVSISLVVLLIGSVVGGIGYVVVKRQTGGFITTAMYGTLSQMTTARDLRDAFGAARAKVMMIDADLGKQVLSLTAPDHLKLLRDAGVDVEKYKSQGYDWVTDIRGGKDSYLRSALPNHNHWLLFSDGSKAVMAILVIDDQNVSEREVCHYAAMVSSNGDGSYTVSLHGMSPSGPEGTGLLWGEWYAHQVLRPDQDMEGLLYYPGEVWKLVNKGKSKYN